MDSSNIADINTVDAYRSKQRSALTSTGDETTAVPEHLEIRPGKRRWLERQNAVKAPIEPPASSKSE